MFKHHVYNAATVAAFLLSCASQEHATAPQNTPPESDVMLSVESVFDLGTEVIHVDTAPSHTLAEMEESKFPHGPIHHKPVGILCGAPCIKQFPNGCIGHGVWICTHNKHGGVCSAPPPHTKKCI